MQRAQPTGISMAGQKTTREIYPVPGVHNLGGYGRQVFSERIGVFVSQDDSAQNIGAELNTRLHTSPEPPHG
jgi:hypothetical protein